MYSGIALTRRMRATSRQPGEEAQLQLDQTVQLHLPHPRGWGEGQRGAPERGCCPKRPWSPLLHPSLFRRGCALFPRRDGHNLAQEATSSQVFCTSHRADGNVGEKHMVGLSHRQRYSVGSWCKGREHLGKTRAKPCSHNHQGSSEMAPQLHEGLTQLKTLWSLLAMTQCNYAF